MNEEEIVSEGGLSPIVGGLQMAIDRMKGSSSMRLGVDGRENVEELAAQCCRALRNLSVSERNKLKLVRAEKDTFILCICVYIHIIVSMN